MGGRLKQQLKHCSWWAAADLRPTSFGWRLTINHWSELKTLICWFPVKYGAAESSQDCWHISLTRAHKPHFCFPRKHSLFNISLGSNTACNFALMILTRRSVVKVFFCIAIQHLYGSFSSIYGDRASFYSEQLVVGGNLTQCNITLFCIARLYRFKDTKSIFYLRKS